MFSQQCTLYMHFIFVKFSYGFYLIHFFFHSVRLFFRFNPIKFEKWNYRNSFFRIMKLYLLKFVSKLLWFDAALYAKKTIAQMTKITSKRMKEDTWWIQRVWRPHRAHQGTCGFSLFKNFLLTSTDILKSKKTFSKPKNVTHFFFAIPLKRYSFHSNSTLLYLFLIYPTNLRHFIVYSL